MAKDRLPSQSEDFPAWYVEVVKRAGMAEHGMAKGTMIIKPHGYAVWEHIQRALDVASRRPGTRTSTSPCCSP